MTYIIFLAVCSVFASIIALFVLIFASYEGEDETRDDRAIRDKDESIKAVKTQLPSLLWTVILGQAVGLYFFFVFVKDVPITNTILRYNAYVLLIASIFCSLLTILNAYNKKRMIIFHRLLFQGYSLALAFFILLHVLTKRASLRAVMETARSRVNIFIILYFSSVVIALFLMLGDGLYRKQERVEYNFNIYFLIVIGVGMFVGIGMYFAKWILTRG